MGLYQLVTVQPGDCLWTIAQHYLGSGEEYRQIVRLNLGHQVGGGEIFTDPSLIWAGWVLQVPAGQAALAGPARHAGHPQHAAHPSREQRFRRPHGAARPAATGGQRDDQPAAAHRPPAQAAVFAADALTGGATAALARMRHRQRQVRRPGRRIPLPASTPEVAVEHRMRAQHASTAGLAPAALRGMLGELGARLLDSGRPLPDIGAVAVRGAGLELLIAGPGGPPPPPWTVRPGPAGVIWARDRPAGTPAAGPESARPVPTGTGDLLPGLLTVGAVTGGYLLADLECLRLTTVEGPPGLAGRMLAGAAAELATSELAGWYDLILAGFGELGQLAGSRATCCDDLDEALDLLAAAAAGPRRRLAGQPAGLRLRRLADPADEDWALRLLVSRHAPAPAQLARLRDLAGPPGGVAVLVPGAEPSGGPAGPASIRLAADPDGPAGIVAQLEPWRLTAWPVPPDPAGYRALTGMFAAAARQQDWPATRPPYDGSCWPPAAVRKQQGLAGGPDRARARQPGPDPGWPRRARQVRQGELRIGVLGPLTVNGAAVPPSHGHLLVALALSGPDGLLLPQLCYLLGAGPWQARPAGELRQLVTAARRSLGPAPGGGEWIVHHDGGQYALHRQARLDWDEFEPMAAAGLRERDARRLTEALRLVRGEPFGDCDLWSLDLALTETVRAQIVDAALSLAGLELAAGNSAAAAAAARAGLTGDPCAEQLWQALMRAEHAAGRPGGVHRAWSDCLDQIAAVAADGEPHPGTVALYRRLAGDQHARPRRD